MRTCYFVSGVVSLLSFFLCFNESESHGRLIEPPSRSSAYRFGFKTPPNYNDNELFCGGFTNQWQRQAGKCGVCGDPWQGPRDNELPNGRYTTKPPTIVRTYKKGQVITVKVDLTKNHLGHFEFRVCPTTSDTEEVTQACLDKHHLDILEATSDPKKYKLPDWSSKVYELKVRLPAGLTCSRCFFQWHYSGGNNWGKCDNGKEAQGCGPQETFRGCADIKIIG